MLATASYGTSPIKRLRRSKADMESLRHALIEIVEIGQPMTVRQVYYQAVTSGLIDKTEAEYKTTICRLLAEMRRAGSIPWNWLADATRWMRRPRTFSGPMVALQETAKFYRRSLWRELDQRVEIWLEKDALAGVLVDETDRYDVPLMVTRGYPSLSFLYSAGEQIAEEGKPTTIYYFGDHDPSGVDIPLKVERELRGFAPGVAITLEVVAVTRQQVIDWRLPTRPTKKSDSRSRSFDGDSVEVDAIPPDTLRWLCRSCLENHIPQELLDHHDLVEQSEREWLVFLANAAARGSLR